MAIISSKDFFVINATPEALAKLDMALAYLQTSHAATKEIQDALYNNRVITIEIIHNGDDTYQSSNGRIFWDPDSALGVIDRDGDRGVQSAALGLGHEFSHANDLSNTTKDTREAYATWVETVIAQELHEATRSSFASVYALIDTTNPTLHTTEDFGHPTWIEKEQNGSDTIGSVYTNTSITPILGPDIVPTLDPVCFGYWSRIEDPLYSEGSGRFIDIWVSDPVVLNLMGAGIDLQSVASSGVIFDMQNSGQAIPTGWITENEGFFIYDNENSAQINSHHDLIPGMAALRQFDSNHDAHLNRADIDWGNLKVWVDAKLDGHFDPTELFTLDQLKIIDINLNFQVSNQNVNGNIITNESAFTFGDGSHGHIGSVELIATPPQHAA